MNKIPLYFFAYFDFEVIKASFESLYSKASQLDIIVIENSSPSTEDKIKPYFLNLLKEGKITRYYLFDKNLANNAFEIVFAKEIKLIAKSEYVFFTDGDLLIEDNADWLEEQLSILQNNPDVFACGITLAIDNLPTNTFPEANTWIPADRAEHETYFEVTTGVHLLVFRTRDFMAYWTYMEKQKINFVDSAMHKFCYNIANKKWARTKTSKARHLTWDSYADLEHPYTKQKLSKSFKNTWKSRNYKSAVHVFENSKPEKTFTDWSRYLNKQVMPGATDILNKIKKRIAK